MKFALLFMAEYTKMIAISAIGATLFFGGYNGPFVDKFPWLGPIYIFIKIIILLFGMIWVRATFPRIRYDRLMAFGWKVLFPVSLALVFITAVGIILAQQVNSYLIIVIPLASLLVAGVSVALIDRTLRRKDYARR
jgi:NADH-quinone oxidoreductase subunit H